jgi:hypothetical protein
MTTKRKFTIGLLLAFVVLAGFAVTEILRGPRSFIAGFDRGMHANYEKIANGETKTSVVEALGEPRAMTDEFNLPQRHGFEHHFNAAERSSAVEYYQWINGMNWYYCIGFDSSGAVVIKGEGHS